MKRHIIILAASFTATLALGVLLADRQASATLNPTLAVTGKLFLSMDGLGINDPFGGTIEVGKPSGATVRTAFLACASISGGHVIADGEVTLNGIGVSWSQNISNGDFPSNTFGDVTSIVKPIVDAASAGRVLFSLAEGDFTYDIDGCALGVIFDDPAQSSDSTILVSFGGQATAGDSFAITLGEPLDLTDPSSRADMGLAISFGAQTVSGAAGSHLCGTESRMDSQIDVNGHRLTSCAGDQDDGVGFVSDGLLFTVGGLDDNNDNPADPFQRAADGALPRVEDDELYDLKPFVDTGDTLITVNTINPSDDDNIFLAYFVTSVPSVVGEGIVLAPASAVNLVASTHMVTATVVDDDGDPVVNRTVTFTIRSGPHTGLTANVPTNSDGKATFSYIGMSAGTDIIQASFIDSQQDEKESNTVEKIWQAPRCLPVPGSCDDGNPCTDDVCDPVNGCTQRPSPNGTQCETAGGCSVGTCAAGACTLGASCRCTLDAECDDSNVCDGTETCDVAAGSCRAGAALSCAQDTNTCTAEVCDPIAGCVSQVTGDGSACTVDKATGCVTGSCAAGACVEDPNCNVVITVAQDVVEIAPKAKTATITTTCSGAPGDQCAAQGFFESPPTAGAQRDASIAVTAAAATCAHATRDTAITKAAKKKIKKSGQAKLKLKLNPIGKCLLRQAGAQGLRVRVSGSVTPKAGGETKLLDILVRVVRRQ